jgi:hypothetical protein
MSTAPRPRPLVPEDLLRDGNPRDVYYGAAATYTIAALNRRDPLQLTRDDAPVNLLLRAASAPATLTDANWASKLAGTAVADVIASLGPRKSAVSELVNRGLKISLDGYASVSVPSRLTVATDAGDWISEGSPFRVRRLDLTGLLLSPYKIGVIIPFTEELAQYAIRDAADVMRGLLEEAFALAIDAKVLSNVAATVGLNPAGLLNGVSGISPSAGTGSAAFAADIRVLVAALAANGGGMDVIFIADPSTVAAIKAYAGSQWDYTVLPSLAVGPKTIIAVEGGSFCSAISAAPTFDLTNQATLHMEDTAPQQISAVGTPPTVAAPVRSLWQSATLALKATVGISFGMRATGHVQTITNVAW